MFKEVSTVSSRKNGLPISNTKPNFQFLAHNSTTHVNFWKIASILYDSVDLLGIEATPNNVDSGLIVNRMRSNLLSDCLKESLNQTLESSVLNCLLKGQLTRASELAANQNNLHLAMLISLLGTNDRKARELSKKQLDYWKSTNSLNSIPQEVLHVYELLSGRTDFVKPENWKQSLGLELWYGTTVFENLPDIIKNTGLNSESPEWKLLEIFGSKDTADSFVTVLDSAPSTFASWVLHLIWSHDSTLKDKSSIDLGLQLASSGFIFEAIFVLSHIESDNLARDYMTPVIEKNVQELLNSSKYTDQLFIDPSYIDKAQALSYRYQGNYYEECKSYISAKSWENAHSVFLRFVAPKLVILNKLGVLFELILSLEPSRSMPGWNTGVQVYLDYIRCAEVVDPDTPQLITSMVHQNFNENPEFSELIKNLDQGFKQMKEIQSFDDLVARGIMSKFIKKFIK